MRYLIILLFCGCHLYAQKTQVAAHRGKTFLRPENTLYSISKALELGVKYIEIDIRTSKDGEQLIMHDGSLKRTTDSNAKVKELTWAELQNVKICGWLNIRFRKNKIPSLEEVAHLVSEWNKKKPLQKVNLYVDCKEADIQKMLSILNKYNLLDDAVFYGKDAFLIKLQAEHPDVRILAGLKKEEDLKVKYNLLKPYAFDISYDLISEEFVNQIHEMGSKVFSDLLFLQDRQKNYKLAQKAGLDLIQTNRSKRALKVLNIK